MLIRPGETMPWCALPDNRTHFTLSELEGSVGGSNEAVPLAGMPASIAVLIVNKDGHDLRLAVNDAASFVVGQPIVGAALMCPQELLR